jgi:uncharacterized protein YbbC (DUF1343 family)
MSEANIMKKLLVMFVMFSFLFAVAAVAQQNTGAETIDLKANWKVEGKKEAVIFDHKLHQTKTDDKGVVLNKCNDCHATEAGGKLEIPVAEIKGNNDKNAAHANCWPCHIEKKVPSGKTCTKCHKKAK